jgi:hypothetical protein
MSSCEKCRSKEYYIKNKEKINTRNSIWWKEKGKEFNKNRREYNLQWGRDNRHKNRIKLNAYWRKYKNSPKEKEKTLARRKANDFWRYKIKPKKCEQCNEIRYLEKHHLDYKQPLLVCWVCNECHKKLNGEMENGNQTNFQTEGIIRVT